MSDSGLRPTRGPVKSRVRAEMGLKTLYEIASLLLVRVNYG